ncbi:acetate CoA-transferase subunit alpha [Frederiksenia canicola]|uniref:Acetate CoA-transferase subunit alpha n=1 Tax=Frederiksenia canicola TaxID=123824 RepID=A0AAE6X4L7_9PAST|nr:acetate CoA-transferase subunit alpha [Frederiksenia canicola]QIM64493.1 acetate CoA-transferase subunit alpha [Frederiksenia canicola]RPE91886.1 acetate CoA/acetoacetate CoA-transferase alpha subunit [Frederiksenia canicola]
MSKVIAITEIKKHLFDGMTILFGGFMGVGTPSRLIQAILDSKVKDLTIIGNDTAFIDTGVGPLISNKRVKKVIASHIGTNAETGRQMIAGEIEVELVPQGTLIERIRAGGAGLGGILTPTGVGTIVEKGKQVIELDSKKYLIERPIRADIAIIGAHLADKKGNLTYQLTTRNFNPIIAFAADRTFVEPDEIVEVGTIDPNHVMTPAAVIDYIILPEEH